MQTRNQSQPALRRIGRGLFLLFLLAGSLVGALFFSLSPLGREARRVQAAPLAVSMQRAADQVTVTTTAACVVDGKFTTTVNSQKLTCEEYLNPVSIGLNRRGVIFSGENNYIHRVVLADVDADGDLDITTGIGPFHRSYDALQRPPEPTNNMIRIHLNRSGRFYITETITIAPSETLSGVRDIAWGDVDGDGDLDLAVGNLGDDLLYIMEDLRPAQLITLPDPLRADDTEGDIGRSLGRTTRVAWGDVDGDGRMELALGNYGRTNKYTAFQTTPLPGINRILYFAKDEVSGAVSVASQTLLTNTLAWTTDLLWNDVDIDGDLDLVVGLATYTTSYPLPMQVYTNAVLSSGERFSNSQAAFPESQTPNALSGVLLGETRILAPAYIDSNNKLALALRSTRYGIKIIYDLFSGDSSNCASTDIRPSFTTTGTELHSLAWGDVDSDGDLDLAVGFQKAPNKVYLNEGGCIRSDPVWESDTLVDNGDGSQTYADTRSVVWGDIDNDGDLDLVAGGTRLGHIYYNESFPFQTTPYHTATLPSVFASQQLTVDLNPGRPFGYVALGDVDNDGDLDIARNIYSQPVHILLNEEGRFETPAITVTSTPITTYVNLRFGDENGDGYLDLFVANKNTADSKLYRNDGNTPFSQFDSITFTGSTLFDGSAVGDIDNDEQLDFFATGNRRLTISTIQNGAKHTYIVNPQSIDLGDIDNDGDLDAAITQYNGLDNQPTGIHIFIYENGFIATPALLITDTNYVRGVAWGDMNGDGYLDLAVALDGFDKVYLNQEGMLEATPAWTSFVQDNTWRLAWGDADGDGDLDLATSSSIDRPQRTPAIHRIYRNEHGSLQPEAAWQSDPLIDATSIAWGDLDGDGLPELVSPTAIHKLNRPAHFQVSGGRAIGIDRRIGVVINLFSDPISPSSTITALATANFHALPYVRESPTIPITFSLFHPVSQTFDAVRVYYSLNQGGQWFPAVDVNGKTQLTELTSSPFPTRTDHNTHRFNWDVIKSNLLGQYDDVVIRIEAYPSLPFTRANATVLYTNSVPNISAIPFVASQTFPFRVRGKQIQVVRDGQGVPGAIVYRIPQGSNELGEPIGINGIPFQTDKNGILMGRGVISPGDQLLALAPVSIPVTMTWATGLTGTLRLYDTSGSSNGNLPCIEGAEVEAGSSKQKLSVSPNCPLVLYDLDVSLEWDASQELRYLDQLKFNLQRASQYLFSFTRGQVALGKVNVFQDADLWAYSHINIHASNRLRPFAAIGGVEVYTATSVIISGTQRISQTEKYGVGQLHMGAVWNRYGEPNPNPGDDWSLILAHELGHYLLSLDDTYIGLSGAADITHPVPITLPVLINIKSCIGSAMGDIYSAKNRGFIASKEVWEGSCAKTLANLHSQQTEWEQIDSKHPWLITPTGNLTSSLPMSFAFTTIQINDPVTPTTVLDNQDFYLRYENGEVGTSEAKAFLLRDDDHDGSLDYIYDLGSPIGTQNLLRAHGVQAGDQLCVFDRVRKHFGCVLVRADDEEIDLQYDETWNPVIQVTPQTGITFVITVENVVSSTQPLDLYARIFPEYGTPSVRVNLQQDGGFYQGVVTLTEAAMAGHIQLVNTNQYTTQQTIVAYSMTGNPGNHRGAGGGDVRAGGSPGNHRGAGGGDVRASESPGNHRGAGGGFQRGGGGRPGNHRGAGGGHVAQGEAPIISPDGQMLFFATESLDFNENEFYLIQDMAGLPPLPNGRVAIGRGYNLVRTSAVTSSQQLTGSISFQYNGLDVLLERVEEKALNIYFWDNETWHRLPTYRDEESNLTSARSRGPGVYALLADRNPIDIVTITPQQLSVGVSTTLLLTETNSLSQISLELIGADGAETRRIDAIMVNPLMVQVTLPTDLPAQVYGVTIYEKEVITPTVGVTLTVTE